MRLVSATVPGTVLTDGTVYYNLECIMEDDATGDGRLTLFPLHVSKRYSEFAQLLEQLLLAGCADAKKFGGGLPPKKLLGSASAKVVRARQAQLERWFAAAVEVYGDHGALLQFLCASPTPTEPDPDEAAIPAPKMKKFDVVISYVGTDRRIVRALADRLRDEDLTVWFPVNETSHHSAVSLRKGVEGAHVVLCCMREEYAGTQHCITECEHLAQLYAKDRSSAPAIVPLIMQQGFTEQATALLSPFFGELSSPYFELWECFDTVATDLISEVQGLLAPVKAAAAVAPISRLSRRGAAGFAGGAGSGSQQARLSGSDTVPRLNIAQERGVGFATPTNGSDQERDDGQALLGPEGEVLTPRSALSRAVSFRRDSILATTIGGTPTSASDATTALQQAAAAAAAAGSPEGRNQRLKTAARPPAQKSLLGAAPVFLSPAAARRAAAAAEAAAEEEGGEVAAVGANSVAASVAAATSMMARDSVGGNGGAGFGAPVQVQEGVPPSTAGTAAAATAAAAAAATATQTVRGFTLQVSSTEPGLVPQQNCRLTVQASTVEQLASAIQQQLGVQQQLVVQAYDTDFEDFLLLNDLSSLPGSPTSEVAAVRVSAASAVAVSSAALQESLQILQRASSSWDDTADLAGSGLPSVAEWAVPEAGAVVRNF